MKHFFLGLVLCATLPCFAADVADEKDLCGTWAPAQAELGGTPLGAAFLKTTLHMDHGKYVVRAESEDKGTYTIDAGVKPKIMDIVGVEGPNAGKKIPAIYELHGDTLRISYGLAGAARPTEFKSPKGSTVLLITYRRKGS
ncbi:MAG TPA: TIGR03067 domain-containing protein [Verrucomicrobiae bacterium]|nr:TIGR03067 domain-containing protein [Verrucomicrobiae bacterium]